MTGDKSSTQGNNASEGLRKQLVRGASGTFGITVANTGLAFLVSIILARVLGVVEYGAYAYAMSWVSLLTVPSLVGMDQLLVRNVATYRAQEAWTAMKGLLLRAFQWSTIATIVLAGGSAIIARGVANQANPLIVQTVLVSLLVLPLFVLMRFLQAVLQGLHRVVIGQVPILVIQPVCLVLFVVLILLCRVDLSAPVAMSVNFAASVIALCIAVVFFWKNLPRELKGVSPSYESRNWAASIVPLTVISTIQIVFAQAGTLMVGTMIGAEFAGIYAVVNRGAGLIAFILIAANSALAPTIANLFAVGDMQRLQSIVTKSVRVVTFFALLGALAAFVAGHWFLLLFGEEFIKGELALVILCVGQFFNATMGSVGVLMVMNGQERYMSICMAASAVLNIALNFCLIPYYGIEGAAAATALSMILLNVILAVQVHRRTGIHSTVLPGFQARKVV